MEQESDRIYSYTVSTKERDQRIDVYLASRVKDLTRSRVQELIKREFVKANGRPVKSGYRVRLGDEISLIIPPATPYHLKAEPVAFTLIHEDASLVVLNKPPGLVMHPSPGHTRGTLVHGLLQHCKDLSGIGGVLRPGIVHRLDKDTSGLVVVAKNDQAHAFLAKQFKAKTVEKRYLAVVHGITDAAKGEIDLPIARHPKKRKEMSVALSKGKRAQTLWEKVAGFGSGLSLLSITPRTGRTHQIRVHLSYVGHPIVGDPVYGYKRTWWSRHLPLKNHVLPHIKRQLLHAETLGFIHPDSERYCQFKAPLPDDMAQVLKALKRIDLSDKRDKNA